MNYKGLITLWKSINKVGYQKHMSDDKILHENSKELLGICENNILCKDMHIFEIGCGCARNLLYFWRKYPDIIISGNDVSRMWSLQHMDDGLEDEIDFYKIDTKSLMDDYYIDVDLLISSDHLSFIDKHTVDYILERIVYKWQPKYVVFREACMPVVDRYDKRINGYVHDYSKINKNYDLIYDEISQHDNNFKIILGKKSEN